ncbi:MAG: hypothetical protein HOZ81_04975 [Streptomyces sp.]|nr:hypothetical protein [Streptomyces sp.]
MTTAVREAPHHNSITCVRVHGCQRVECRERLNAYYRTWRRSRKNPVFIDAEPVRQHLELLVAADVTPTRVATLTGLALETVAGFVRPYSSGTRRYGRKRKVHPDVAAKILALDPETTTPGIVDATGSIRRIQALCAAGWPMLHLAGRLGVNERTVRMLPRQERMTARLAAQIAAVYEELKQQNPKAHGVSPTSIKRAHERAKAKCWPTPKYWADRMDVIDDPHFEPMYGVTRRLIVAQDANELMRVCGLDRAAAAERLGVSKAYIDHAFRDHPEYAIEVAA